MRSLNNEEQDFCMRILEGNGNNNYLGNIIDNHLWGVRISITRSPQKVDLLLTIKNEIPTPEETDMVIERIGEISVLILNVVNLVHLLEKENYIMLLQRSSSIPNTSAFGQGVVNSPYITSNFSDQKIAALLIDIVEKEIFVTEEFRQFCARKFIGRDEQRFRRQITITTSALIVTITALLVNTFFNVYSVSKTEKEPYKTEVKIFEKELKNLNSNLDSLRCDLKNTSKEILDLSEREKKKMLK